MKPTEHEFVFPDIETARLMLRVLTLEDADEVYRHFSDEDVTQFMDTEPCKVLSDAEKIILFHEKDTGCRWGVFDKETDALLGTCGYHCWDTGDHPKAEIGYDLGKAFWGQRLMQEALLGVIPFGFETMDLTRVEASVHPDNQRSIRLLEKLGFSMESPLRNGLIWFHLLEEVWTAGRSPANPSSATVPRDLTGQKLGCY